MKNIYFIVVFLTVAILSQSAFSEENGAEAVAEACTAGDQKNCNDPHAMASSHEEQGKDWSHKRQEQVAQIYPQLGINKAAVLRPEKVQLTAPAFLAKISGGSVTLKWSEAAGAQNYHVQVSKDAGFNNRSMYVAEEKFVSGTSFEVKNLEAGQKYFWRVASYNRDQESMYTKSPFASSVFQTAE
jgi:hypothetical protein